jgi:hypothetical protein
MASPVPLTNAIQQQFQELSRNRDTPSESITEERFIPTEDGGYIHEVTSRTTPRRRPDTGEEISTVTQRRVATIANPEGIMQHAIPGGSLQLKYTHKVPQSISPGPSSRSTSTNNNAAYYTASTGPSSYFGTNNQGSSRSIIQQQQQTPSGNSGNWRYNAQQQQQQASAAGNFQNEPIYAYEQNQMRSLVPPPASPGSHGKNVGFGQNQTIIIDPTRISPLNPERNYAPLKYVTRRQLREMQQRGTHRNLPNRLRTSSVPRLDELVIQEQQQHREQVFHQRDPRRVYGEYPEAEDYGPRAFYDPDQQIQQYAHNHRSISQHSQGGRSPSLNSNAVRYYNGGAHNPMSIDRYNAMPNVDGDEMVTRFAACLAQVRGIERIPEPPAYCGAAMRLLLRGTYLVHYGGRVPHERYFMLRMLKDERGRSQPYFTWSLHQDSSTYTERIHLAHLAGVGRGTSSPRFQRHHVDPAHLRGPFVGDEPSIVGCKYAFSFVFQSKSANRQVDVLALDDQTFRCWLLVCDYLADVNANAAVDQEYEAETMAPDTPKSHSGAASHAG